MSKRAGLYVVAAGAVLVALYLTLNTYYISDHEVGVLVDNGVVTGTVGPGWGLAMPLTTIKKIPVVPQSRKVTGLSMATRDNFAMVNSVIGYTFRIPADEAARIYRENPAYESQLHSVVAQEAKNVVGSFKLINIPRSRPEIENRIQRRVNRFARKHFGISHMVTNVALKYYGWQNRAKEYLASIRAKKQAIREAKLTAKHNAIVRKDRKAQALAKAKRRKIAARAKAQRRKIAAQAKAERRKIAARSKKEAAILRAQGQAEATRLNNAALMEKLRAMVELLGVKGTVAALRWQKWNGQMPQIVSGDNGLSIESEVPLSTR